MTQCRPNSANILGQWMSSAMSRFNRSYVTLDPITALVSFPIIVRLVENRRIFTHHLYLTHHVIWLCCRNFAAMFNVRKLDWGCIVWLQSLTMQCTSVTDRRTDRRNGCSIDLHTALACKHRRAWANSVGRKAWACWVWHQRSTLFGIGQHLLTITSHARNDYCSCVESQRTCSPLVFVCMQLDLVINTDCVSVQRYTDSRQLSNVVTRGTTDNSTAYVQYTTPALCTDVSLVRATSADEGWAILF